MSYGQLSCHFCHAELKNANELEVHLISAHGPLICAVCGGHFRIPDELSAHIAICHQCPRCDEQHVTARLRDRHLAEIHGLAWQIVEPKRNRVATLGYLPGRKPILVPPPDSDEDRCRWLYPLCLEIVDLEQPAKYLKKPPADLQSQAFYVQGHLAKIFEMRQLARYKQRATLRGRAAYLARVLARPELRPAYAEQKLQHVNLRGLGTESPS